MILERNFNFPTTRMRNSGKNWTEGMRMYPMNINLISYTCCIVQMWKIFFHPVYALLLSTRDVRPTPTSRETGCPAKYRPCPAPPHENWQNLRGKVEFNPLKFSTG